MAAKERKPALRLQDFPPEVIIAIVERIESSDRENFRLAGIGTNFGDVVHDFGRSAPLQFRLDLGTRTIYRGFDLIGIARELRANRLLLTALEARKPDDWRHNETFLRLDTLGGRISRTSLCFPSLRHLVLDANTTCMLDLLPYMVDFAPHLETLVVDLSYAFPSGKIDSAPHDGIRNLHITVSDHPKSVNVTARLLELCPRIQQLCLHRFTYYPFVPTKSTDRHATYILVGGLSGFPIVDFESRMAISVFASCVAEKKVLLPEVRRMWLILTRQAFEQALYPISDVLAPSWPTLGMSLALAGCLYNCPKLDTLYAYRRPEARPTAWKTKVHIISYTNSAGIGELLHAVILWSGEWEDATHYRGEVVPLEVIDDMRAAEQLTDEAWPGTQRGRGRAVGNAAWAILTEWYMNGPRIPRAHTPWIHTPRERDGLRDSCCLQ